MKHTSVYVQRSAGDEVIENRTVTKYGVVFNSDSHPLSVRMKNGKKIHIVEQIRAESLSDAVMDDVIATFNHNFNQVLGRMSNGTLSLSMDKRGIKYTVEVGNTSYGDDLLANLKRGDVVGSSFIFGYDPDLGYEIEERSDGVLVGYPKRITKIVEMGPVTNPAYPGTNQSRNLDPLVEAAKRFMDVKDENLETREAEEIAQEEVIQERAMDVMRKFELVSSEFYRQFEGDGVWFYIRSMTVDDELVAKERPSNSIFKLGFTLNADNTVTFDERESWTQVEMEYVPIGTRAFYEGIKPEDVHDEDKPERRTEEVKTTGDTSIEFVKEEEDNVEEVDDKPKTRSTKLLRAKLTILKNKQQG